MSMPRNAKQAGCTLGAVGAFLLVCAVAGAVAATVEYVVELTGVNKSTRLVLNGTFLQDGTSNTAVPRITGRLQIAGGPDELVVIAASPTGANTYRLRANIPLARYLKDDHTVNATLTLTSDRAGEFKDITVTK